MTDPVTAFLDAASAHPQVDIHSLLVRDASGVQLEAYWDPYRRDDRQLVYSASKTLTGTAVGFAVAEGLVRLDDRVVDLVAPPFPVDGRRREITVHHLLSMSTGHDADTLDPAADPESDLAAQFWRTDPQTPVGSQHAYNNGASWALGEVVRTVTGGSLLDYLRPRLFDPLGIDVAWDVDSRGAELGFSGAHLTTRALAAIGQVYASGGRWQGQQVLPDGWPALAGSRHVPSGGEDPEWAYGYGYQVWLSREGFRLDGAFGQYALVLPETETVVAITAAQAVTSQPLLDMVWQHLVPGVGPTTAEREERLAGLALAVPRDARTEGVWRHDGPVPVRPSLALGVEQGRLPRLADLVVTRDGAGFCLRGELEGAAFALTTAGSWRRQVLRSDGVDVPVAVAAGVTSRGGVRLCVCVTDTPHVLLIDIDGRGAGMAWQTPPLHMSRFAQLAAR